MLNFGLTIEQSGGKDKLVFLQIVDNACSVFNIVGNGETPREQMLLTFVKNIKEEYGVNMRINVLVLGDPDERKLIENVKPVIEALGMTATVNLDIFTDTYYMPNGVEIEDVIAAHPLARKMNIDKELNGFNKFLAIVLNSHYDGYGV